MAHAALILGHDDEVRALRLKAVDAARRYLDSSPDDDETLEWLVYTYLQLGDHENRLALARLLAEKKPDEPAYLADVGEALLFVERWDEAARTATSVLEAWPAGHPGRPFVLAHLAVAQAARGRTAEAARTARKAAAEAKQLQAGLGWNFANVPESLAALDHPYARQAAQLFTTFEQCYAPGTGDIAADALETFATQLAQPGGRKPADEKQATPP
jgi:tetratricopeptide (TPR) repeat protein